MRHCFQTGWLTRGGVSLMVLLFVACGSSDRGTHAPSVTRAKLCRGSIVWAAFVTADAGVGGRPPVAVADWRTDWAWRRLRPAVLPALLLTRSRRAAEDQRAFEAAPTGDAQLALAYGVRRGAHQRGASECDYKDVL